MPRSDQSDVTPKADLRVFIVGAANTGTLRFTSNVEDAQVLVDTKPHGTSGKDGKMRTVLPLGTHHLQAVRDGYVPSDSVRVSNSRAADSAVTLNLTPRAGLLLVRGAIPGTEVQVDHVRLVVVSETRSLQGTVAPGNHTMIVPLNFCK